MNVRVGLLLGGTLLASHAGFCMQVQRLRMANLKGRCNTCTLCIVQAQGVSSQVVSPTKTRLQKRPPDIHIHLLYDLINAKRRSNLVLLRQAACTKSMSSNTQQHSMNVEHLL